MTWQSINIMLMLIISFDIFWKVNFKDSYHYNFLPKIKGKSETLSRVYITSFTRGWFKR